MSYIRCLSNPENLYIWEGFDRTVTISMGPHGDKDSVEETMPVAAFEGVLRQWWKKHDFVDVGEVVEFKGATIKTTKDFKWELRYELWPKKKKVVMWETTLHYICTTNRFKWAK